MEPLKIFLEFWIERLIPDPAIPVDLDAVCALRDVTIEEREMIPEAVMQVVGGRFHIFLQSNFRDTPGARIRQRFSLAHELGHTLFFDQENGELKPRKDSPRGDNLEAVCHKAASMILIPSKALHREIKKQAPTTSGAILEVANRFDVSAEVMLRRLSDLDLFDQDWVPVLTRQGKGGTNVEFAPYPPWLRSRLTQPSRGVDFFEWFRGSEQSDGKFIRKAGDGVLEATPVRLPGSSVIFELRLQMVGPDQQISSARVQI